MTRWLRFSTRLRASVSSRVAFSDSVRSCARRACVAANSFSASPTRPLQLLDLGAHRDQFDLAAVRRHRTVGQFVIDLGEFALLVGQRGFGVAQHLGLGGEFLFGGAQLLLHRLLARFEREDRGVLFAKLDLHAVDRIGLLAEFGELAGGLVLELIDAHLEPPRRHREFRAQLVLVGLDLGHRQRRRRLQPPGRQPHRAVMHQRHDHQAKQHRDQKTDRQIHDRFDHGWLLRTKRKLLITMPWRTGPRPAHCGVNLNRRRHAGTSERRRRLRTGSRSRAG